ncbi:MAG: hypothetical protein HY835_01260, partial [Anaerolineae bacterium]|nr:hypothetical protein [Anaerolineae bacterium]
MDSESTLSSDRDQMDLLRIPIFLFLLIILTFVLRRAWMADDAYITLRSVDNWMHGFGPVFNPGYRVQAYTHPLWMLVLAGFYMLTHEASYTTIAINLALTAFMLGWMVRFSRKDLGMLIALLLLGFSSSFIDYSTSGLENTLSHALIVVFITLYTTALAEQRRVGWAALCGGLLVLNRLDLSLIVFPALAYGLWKWRSWFAVKWLVLGLSPVLAWEIFSIIYYGMPFPNTYYAKLNAGIPNVEMIRQGIVYIFATLRNDPITLAGIGMGTVLPLIMRRKELYPLILGILFYLGYILWIGGDFMEGRFLSVPLVSAAMIISMTWSGPHNTWVAALAGA